MPTKEGCFYGKGEGLDFELYVAEKLVLLNVLGFLVCLTCWIFMICPVNTRKLLDSKYGSCKRGRPAEAKAQGSKLLRNMHIFSEGVFSALGDSRTGLFFSSFKPSIPISSGAAT